ncbi:MAG TPA: RNA polymerase sigma factor [Polyangiaceae bacterium]|nr:RNA polymerase sigma factor [Polyangiaceae bacterium]
MSLLPSPAAGGPGGLEVHDDDELMLLARGGVEAAFPTLIRRHQARALRVAGRYLGRDSWAADVVQDTFVEILRALPRYQAHGKFSSFLYRVLLNRCHMTWRTSRAERRALETVSQQLPEVDEGEILRRERRRDLTMAIGQLSEKLRVVVLLRYSAELSYEEIAETLDIPVGTVKRRLFDSMTKLRDLLEGA